MAEDFILKLIAERLGGDKFLENSKKEYKFGKIKRLKREAIAANPGIEILDFGIGEPHQRARDDVVDVLAKEARKWENRVYSDNGPDDVKDKIAAYLKKEFGVEVDPRTQVQQFVGAKNILGFTPFGFVNPGDVVFQTRPGYPVLATISSWIGGKVVDIPLLRANKYLPDLDKISEEDAKAAKMLSLNYPNNPTGAVADESFYREAIVFAKKYNVMIVHDSAYAPLRHRGRKMCFLEVDGASDVGIEVFSASKAYNATGWRFGFAAGNPLAIQVLANVKDNLDSGQFLAIQYAIAYAMDHPEITEEAAGTYRRRLEMMSEVLRSVGIQATTPDAGFFLYVPCPKGTTSGREFKTADDFTSYLLTEKQIVAVPWDDVPSEPGIRFAACFPALTLEEEIRILEEFNRRMSTDRFVY